MELIKVAQTDYPIHEFLSRRWSPRAFAKQPIEPEKIRSLLEAARWSASGGNLQPWAFLIATREQSELFARMVGCLAEGNVPWASRAALLGITVARLLRPSGQPNRHAWHDVGLAMQNLVVQATALDIYVHQMGGFSADKARIEFDIPVEHEAVTMFAAGYLGDPATLPEKNRESELSLRTRRPLQEFVFGERWGDVAAIVET
jgi:nitroreductase